MRKLLLAIYAPVSWWGGRRVETDPLRQSAWERGKSDAAKATRDHPAFGVFVTVIPAVLAAIYAGPNLPIRLIATAGASLLGYVAVPAIWAGVATLRAPRRQRDEARAVVQAEQVRAQQRFEAEQDRLQAQVAAEREAFENKWKETEDLRGQLGEALNRIGELESELAAVPAPLDQRRLAIKDLARRAATALDRLSDEASAEVDWLHATVGWVRAGLGDGEADNFVLLAAGDSDALAELTLFQGLFHTRTREWLEQLITRADQVTPRDDFVPALWDNPYQRAE